MKTVEIAGSGVGGENIQRCVRKLTDDKRVGCLYTVAVRDGDGIGACANIKKVLGRGTIGPQIWRTACRWDRGAGSGYRNRNAAVTSKATETGIGDIACNDNILGKKEVTTKADEGRQKEARVFHIE